MNLNTKDKIKGAFLGLYFGAGANPRFSPMLSPQEARQRYSGRKFGDYGEYDFYKPLYTLFDQHTMTKIVYDILLKYGEITPEIFRDYLLELHDKYDVFSGDVYGPSTQKAVSKIQAGEDIYEMGKTGITCGSAMRAMPVALWFYDDLDKLIENTVGACIISHNTDVALDAAIAVNVTLAALIKGKSKQSAVDEAITVTKNNHGKYGAQTQEPKIHEILEEVRQWTKNADAEGAQFEIPNRIGVSWFARETIPGAFANYLVTQNPEESSLLSLRCGGDNQTVPEIACAFHGAEQGVDAIPLEIVKKIEMVNNVEILATAERVERAIS